MKENRKIVWGIWLFSAVVFLLVMLMREIPKPHFRPPFTHYQPLIHACCNGSVFILLVLSLIAVKQKQIELHKKLNTVAMSISLLFLLSYVVYHFFSPETKYGGEHTGIYFFILASHVVLAAVSLPFILMAYYRAYIGQVDKHRKMVKMVYPIWLYVALTGVLVYLFLSPYYA